MIVMKDGVMSLMLVNKYNSEPEIIEALIMHGADVKTRAKIGKTALDAANINAKRYKTKIYRNMNDLMNK